jgi:acetyl-CoA acetyltransferase
MSSDVFIISSARNPAAPVAIRQAVELAGLSPSRIQDVVFGFDQSSSIPDLDSISRASGLACPSVGVSSSLRALFFAADSILSDDVELAVVTGLDADSSTAFLLASPEMVGRLNLLPRARIAAHSLAGPEPALRLAGLASADVEISKSGERGAALASELLDELETQSARWGLISVSTVVLLLERI